MMGNIRFASLFLILTFAGELGATISLRKKEINLPPLEKRMTCDDLGFDYVENVGCLYHNPTRLNYFDAEDVCASLGSVLLPVEGINFPEDIIDWAFSSDAYYFYVGVKSENNDGTFSETLDPDVWAPGEPEPGYPDRICAAAIAKYDLRLYPHPCDVKWHSVCYKPS